MSTPTTITLPADLARALSERAAKHGMSIEAYIAFLARVSVNRLDRDFASATRAVFKRYPETLRTLSQ